MSRNKLIMIASMMLTIVIITSWLGEGETPAGARGPDEQTLLSLPDTGSIVYSCPSMPDFMMHNPDATPNEMYEVEECNREIARQTGKDRANSSFLGNTRSRPPGALAHYEFNHEMGAFTVFDDRIEASDGSNKTVIPFSRVTDVGEDWEMPSALSIEYTSEHGTPMAYTFMMLRDDDMIKAEGARDIDRLIALLEDQL